MELNREGTYPRWLEERRMHWRPNVVVRKMGTQISCLKGKEENEGVSSESGSLGGGK